MSDSVIDAMEMAVRNDPSNVELRSHLAGLLSSAERPAEAFAHARAGLQLNPAHTGLLDIAANTGALSGHQAEADGYRTLHAAITGATKQPNPPSDAPVQYQPPDQDPSPSHIHHTESEDEIALLTAGVPDSVDDLMGFWDENDAPAEPAVGELSRDRVYLRDVGGMDDVKKRLQLSFLTPMQNPEMRNAFGKSMRGGLLLWGPPGCGKTFIAKAVAGELNANFYQVGLSDVLDMYIGSSEKNITSIFETARRNAPCVLFLDEVDALGQKRTQLRGGGSGMRGVVNQLLQEMDGAASNNEGVFVLAATNHPWDIDSALLRPGRLDRMLLVLPPDVTARESILSLHLRGRPVAGLNLIKVAKATDGLTGADLALVCEQATEYAMLDSIESGVVRPITMKDLGRAVKEIKPSHMPWVESAKNFAMFNNESGTYDELLEWLRKNKIR